MREVQEDSFAKEQKQNERELRRQKRQQELEQLEAQEAAEEGALAPEPDATKHDDVVAQRQAIASRRLSIFLHRAHSVALTIYHYHTCHHRHSGSRRTGMLRWAYAPSLLPWLPPFTTVAVRNHRR